MKLLLVFGLFPDEHKENILKNDGGVIQFAADALQQSLLAGLSHLTDVSIINLPYIGSYPKDKTFYYPFYKFRTSNEIEGNGVGFCNLIGYKLYSRYRNAKKAIGEWIDETDGNKIIFIYAIHIPFLRAAVEMKRKTPDVKITLIIPDLLEHMSDRRSLIYSWYLAYNEKEFTNLFQYVDGYVVLSRHMIEALPKNDKPWVVVEGIFNPDDIPVTNYDVVVNKKQILYSGSLAKRYGILNLVDAFSLLSNQDIELIICGDGDARGEIETKAKKDSRIIYKGQLPRVKILEMQQKATLLVNPRTSEGEFTKYSFPFKTMEYLASGTPTLMYRLEGIPLEYYDHCFTISVDDYSVEKLSSRMDEILNEDIESLKRKGEQAKQFILLSKNPQTQCMKIIDLLNKI